MSERFVGRVGKPHGVKGAFFVELLVPAGSLTMLYGDDAFATQLREAVIASVTVAADAPSTSKRRAREASPPTLATAAATLKSKLTAEDTALTAPERALMQQWLTALADARTAEPSTSRRRPQHIRTEDQ